MTISAQEARALLDAATAGPWHTMMGWGGVRLGIEADDFSVVVYGTDDDDAGVERDEDARLIAAAPDLAATVIELSERIDKVLALHRKTTEEMLDHKCADGDCEHEDECPSVSVDVCRCCTEIAYQVSDEYWPAAMSEIAWPCPTVLALTQGGEQS